MNSVTMWLASRQQFWIKWNKTEKNWKIISQHYRGLNEENSKRFSTDTSRRTISIIEWKSTKELRLGCPSKDKYLLWLNKLNQCNTEFQMKFNLIDFRFFFYDDCDKNSDFNVHKSDKSSYCDGCYVYCDGCMYRV